MGVDHDIAHARRSGDIWDIVKVAGRVRNAIVNRWWHYIVSDC